MKQLYLRNDWSAWMATQRAANDGAVLDAVKGATANAFPHVPQQPRAATSKTTLTLRYANAKSRNASAVHTAKFYIAPASTNKGAT